MNLFIYWRGFVEAWLWKNVLVGVDGCILGTVMSALETVENEGKAVMEEEDWMCEMWCFW